MKPSDIMALRDTLVHSLTYTVGDAQRLMRLDPFEYSNDGDDPYIDVRLCIDGPRWTVRLGSVDYDPYHSEICAASVITPQTDIGDLADELISEACDLAAQR